MTNNISVTVNSKTHTATVENRDLLVHFLRKNLSLTGTRIDCDTSSGACTIHVDGKAVKFRAQDVEMNTETLSTQS